MRHPVISSERVMRTRIAVPLIGVVAFAALGSLARAQTASGGAATANSGPGTGTWQVTAGISFAPWTIDLKQSGLTLTGTVRQSGGLRGPSEIRDASITGDVLTFKADSPSGGRVITFIGAINKDSIAFTRSVLDTLHVLSGAGVFGASGAMAFVAHRADSAAAAAALSAAAPTASVGPGTTGGTASATATRSAATSTAPRQGAIHWVADSVSAGGPWVFDVDITGGTLTGLADQASGVTGAYRLENGKVVGDSIFFSIHYTEATIDREIDFAGKRSGDGVVFSRQPRAISGGTVGSGLVGGGGSTTFSVRRARPGEALPGPREERTLTPFNAGGATRAASGAPAAVKRVPFTGANGPWRVDNVPGGPWTFDLAVDKSRITGTVHESDGPVYLASAAAGTFDGTTLTFKVLGPKADRLVTFKGTLAGDKITFTRR